MDELTKEIINLAEEGIEEFISYFFDNPEFFFHESDLHPYLFMKIYNKLKERNNLSVGFKSRLHREVPTKSRYVRDKKSRFLKVSSKNSSNYKSSKKGHFDLAILDIDKTKDERFDNPIVAIELKMNHSNDYDMMIYNDWLKLTDKNNGIKKGILLFFIRKGRYEKKKKRCFEIKKLERIIERHGKVNSNILLYYIEYDEHPWTNEEITDLNLKNPIDNGKWTKWKLNNMIMYKNKKCK